MTKKNIHIVPKDNRWAVKKEGTSNPLSTHRTKALADKQARQQAKKDRVELVIHGLNGRI
ncbi:MAG: DUF2188 domain-containing protein [Candidatus Pacebacteria bacterium]|nr:DUF2188 domain-containing protein [Candidatus Paceibacterota bacterium]